MRKKNQRNFIVTFCLFALFVIFTVAVKKIGVKPIGPRNSEVGFAALNEAVHNGLGVHMNLYYMTDWLSLVPAAVVLGFALLGLVQLIKRKNLWKVDYSILVLGVYYVLVGATYVFFEKVVINYRPVLIEDVLEASYPSSTTMLMLCVMIPAMMQFHERIHNVMTRRIVNVVTGIYTIAMVACRLISGVHWFTDICGGIIISTTLIMLYYSLNTYVRGKLQK